MINMHKQKGIIHNQRGLVSLTVTIIVMIVITLIVSSFALIVRREQKRALDRQLSSQAFYAAETGVEDAIQALSYPVDTNRLDEDVNDCTGPDSFIDKTASLGQTFDPVISENIEYSCVLINQTPGKWETSSANTEDGGFVVPIEVDPDGPTIDTIRISWQHKDGDPNNFQPPGSFPELPQSGMGMPMLRVTVLPGFTATGLSRAEIEAGAHTVFLYPLEGAANSHGNVTYIAGGPDHASQGVFVPGACNASHSLDDLPLHCNVDIGGGDMTGRHQYFVHVQPLYQSAAISMQAFGGGSTLPLYNSQAVVDVTGKAADVLRRIQVRVPIGDGARIRNLSGLLPPGALVTEESICKKWEITGSDTAVDGCNGGVPITLSSAPAPGGAAGLADIGPCDPATDPGCVSNTGNVNSPEFRWSQRLHNRSNNPPNLVLNCTWDWGDGTSDTFPGNHSACTYGGSVVHDYNPPVDSRGWESLISSTNGASGCWTFNPVLTMRFVPGSGLSDSSDNDYFFNLPGGKANDEPNPTTGQGICYGNYQTFIP